MEAFSMQLTPKMNPIGWRSRPNEEILLLFIHLARLFSCGQFLWTLYRERACSYALKDKTGLFESGRSQRRFTKCGSVTTHIIPLMATA